MTEFRCVRCDNVLCPGRVPTGRNDVDHTMCSNCNCNIVFYSDEPYIPAHISGWRIDFVRHSIWSLSYWVKDERKICVVPIENRTMWIDALIPTNAIELPYLDPKDLTEERIETWLLLR
jgi:hypothetical protein